MIQPSGIPITQKKTAYDWSYQYIGKQPHAPTHIGDRTFTYDDNGNQTGWDHDLNGTRRSIVWDEENRIQSLFDNGHEKTYKYDDQGQRIIKRGPQGETVYVNQYFTIRNREVGTKHVYAGTSRLASKMMKQDKPGANPQGQTPIEKDRYFYHPDHLGSSSYVTDAQGKLYEHLEYFPFGESWVEESSNTQRTPYLFTAKELDEETGLYYFGARYYDPRTSVWQSGDPILEKYLPTGNKEKDRKLAGMGGVFTSQNLALYNNAHLNPVRLMDPDGREVGLQWHFVAADNYHTLIRITPENQGKYANDPRFQNVDEQGRRYATIGAGPEGGILVSNINRPRDAAPHQGGNLVSAPNDVKNEDEFIDRLFSLDASYGDNLDYDLFPAASGQGRWWLADDSYNSNSYTAGLLQGAGANVAPPSVNTPGFSKPVPRGEFAPKPAQPSQAPAASLPSLDVVAP